MLHTSPPSIKLGEVCFWEMKRDVLQISRDEMDKRTGCQAVRDYVACKRENGDDGGE